MGKVQSDLASNHAVARFAGSLKRHQVTRLLSNGEAAPVGGRTRVLRDRLSHRYALDLAGFLNCLRREELNAAARAWQLPVTGPVGQMRARLWRLGAELEAGGTAYLGTSVQPTPIVLGGKLVHCIRGEGVSPVGGSVPRGVPPPRDPVPAAEPQCLEDLLHNADAMLGVRLGTAIPDKGAYGSHIARLLGLVDRGYAEPDWRGEVEVKSIPVVLDRAGWWRVKEDPAISMDRVEPMDKLVRVLWIVRVSVGDSPILSWYYQEMNARLSVLAARFLHKRPKGPKGTARRGWYLQKRFFIESGLLYSLNG